MTDPQPGSVYELAHEEEAENLATFAVLVDNEPGVLHRLVGLFAARGYNIESLTVAETDRRSHTSRVTIVTRGTPHVLAQIEAQLEKMVSVREVQDVTRHLCQSEDEQEDRGSDLHGGLFAPVSELTLTPRSISASRGSPAAPKPQRASHRRGFRNVPNIMSQRGRSE